MAKLSFKEERKISMKIAEKCNKLEAELKRKLKPLSGKEIGELREISGLNHFIKYDLFEKIVRLVEKAHEPTPKDGVWTLVNKGIKR